LWGGVEKRKSESTCRKKVPSTIVEEASAGGKASSNTKGSVVDRLYLSQGGPFGNVLRRKEEKELSEKSFSAPDTKKKRGGDG